MKQTSGWIRSVLLIVVAVAAAGGWLSREQLRDAPHTRAPVAVPQWQPSAGAALPTEALHTLQLIEAGGPYPYDRDGTVFQNREGRLPSRPRGHYREYTVRTPGSRDRGARRIVSGGDPPTEFFYTDDHYRTFRRIEAATQ
jgi:ribonuclease T1